jgi:hypothetical protein
VTDARLRGLERAWLASGQEVDAEAYVEALRRAGAPERAIHRVQGRWGTPARYTASEILDQLDAAAQRFKFPMLDNGYVFLADVRLRAFRDPGRWAIVIEVLGFNPRGGGASGFQTVVYTYGSRIRRPGCLNEDFHEPISRGPSAPIEDDEEDGGELVHPRARDLRIRGEIVALPRARAHYRARKITLGQSPWIQLFELLRGLLPEHRDALLATEAEARRRVPKGLAPFLTLDAWIHPDLADEELPSGSATFQQLAAALVSGDPDAFVAPKRTNTHWRHWPEGGTL